MCYSVTGIAYPSGLLARTLLLASVNCTMQQSSLLISSMYNPGHSWLHQLPIKDHQHHMLPVSVPSSVLAEYSEPGGCYLITQLLY